MHGPRHQHPRLLQGRHRRRQPAPLLVRPRVELLAQHYAAGARPHERVRRRVAAAGVEEGLDGQHGEGHGSGEGVQVVRELPTGYGPRPAVVPLEGLDLGAKHRRRRTAVVVDGPVVDAGAEVGEDVTDVRGEERFHDGAGVGCGGGRLGQGAEHGGKAGGDPRAVRPRGAEGRGVVDCDIGRTHAGNVVKAGRGGDGGGVSGDGGATWAVVVAGDPREARVRG